MGIDVRRWLLGGLAAGVCLLLLDSLVNGVLLVDQNEAALTALDPALVDSANSAFAIAFYVAVDLVMGLIVVWTYAAIRPRFGPGPRTALLAGGLIWFVVVLTYKLQTVMGMWEWGYFIPGALIYLVIYLTAAYVGGMLYGEGPPDGVMT
jgi:hypothetical protein